MSHHRVAESGAKVAGERVTVAIEGRLRAVYPAAGAWWASIESPDACAPITVPLILVRMEDRLYLPVEVPGAKARS